MPVTSRVSTARRLSWEALRASVTVLALCLFPATPAILGAKADPTPQGPVGWSTLPEAEAAEPLVTASLSLPAFREPEPLLQPLPPLQAALPPPMLAMDELAAPFELARPAVPAATAGDIEIVRQALSEYRKGRLAEGDAIASRAQDEAARLAMEWGAIRLGRQRLGFARIARFAEENPAFPMADWVRRRAEEALFVEPKPADVIIAFFRGRAPEMAGGAMAFARALNQRGQSDAAQALVKTAWRDKRTSVAVRAAMLKEFPDAISPADRQFLAEKLIYDGETGEGLRIAAGAGPKAQALAQVLAASVNETGAALALVQKLETAWQGEPAAIFARAQHFRRAGQPQTAAQAMFQAPTDPAKIVDGDEWWIERRMLARRLLDAGDAATAYRIAAGHSARSAANRVDAETHAGWLALRFLNQPDVAERHFATARAIATAPASLSRASYWRGRAAEALGQIDATDHYRDAAIHRHTFHGQLAAARLTETPAPIQLPAPDIEEMERATRQPGLRALRVLIEADAKDLAQPLIADAAAKSQTLAEALAVGDLAARFGLTRLTLLAGKSAMQRGMPAKEHAFPIFGIPPYPASPDYAEPAIVYSIARQESEFEPKAISHAGARGLMQLMPATARRSAAKARLPYDVNALTADPALNVRIGAAHLGELFAEYNGSYILSFAAYNAGGGRVKEWIAAYGDPRDPKVDKIDWIERIPITETRHYVQKVLENLQVYRALLDRRGDPGIAADLMRGVRRPGHDLAWSRP